MNDRTNQKYRTKFTVHAIKIAKSDASDRKPCFFLIQRIPTFASKAFTVGQSKKGQLFATEIKIAGL